MNTPTRRMDASFLQRWTLATFSGWILGFVATLLVAKLVNSLYPHVSKLVVGVCIGAAVGVAQFHVFSLYRPVSRWWVFASSIGLGLPFIVLGVLDAIGLQSVEASGAQYLARTLLLGAPGGLLSALLQLRCLRQHFKSPAWWLAINSAGWGMCWLLFSLTAPFALIGAVMGATLVGSVTGIGLMLMPRHHPTNDSAQASRR